MSDEQPMTWSEKLDELIRNAVKDCSFNFPISLDVLADAAVKWARPSLRLALAKKRARDELGKLLRRRPSAEVQPLIPDLLDIYAETEGGYVHMSQLPRNEIQHRRNKLQQRITSELIRLAAYDELLSHDLPEEGIA
jgi:hypothetical protein